MKTLALTLVVVMMLSVMQVTSARRAYCLLPPNAGRGQLAKTRFYWDTAAAQCRQFTYRGWGGNANRFVTRENCRTHTKMKTLALTLVVVMMLSVMQVTSARRAYCLLPPDAGRGDLAKKRFYWDTAAAQCRQFTYRGLGGNANRFATLENCRTVCLE
ncbi:tissue factor pathway inhibitor-like [Ylistrum balloti]|uniref:tissue factor pathway inhibitor-like n=1 Tax=Ylistrum balloti TaxID=509963 RepID=UPI00290594C9|nr:tissue factor pathway inhibitor-like [Ylistrum balloti]